MLGLQFIPHLIVKTQKRFSPVAYISAGQLHRDPIVAHIPLLCSALLFCITVVNECEVIR